MLLIHKLKLVFLLLSWSSYLVLADVDIFKINKLNLVWTKAQHSLGPTKLKDLKSDLLKQQLDEIALKNMKAHNQDKDGLFEATIRKKLLNIMSKYSLDRYYDDIHPPVHNNEDLKIGSADQIHQDQPTTFKNVFRDKRLDKLWSKAEKMGLTQEQLMILQEEFKHYQDKLDEHYEIMDKLDQNMEQNETHDRWENSLENESDQSTRKSKKIKSHESSADKKGRLDSNTQQSLKSKYSKLKQDIDKLLEKVLQRNLKDNSDGPFEEAPVNELWAAAKDSNLGPVDLESFKEELEHYESRIKKLKHYEVQLERDMIISKKESYGEPSDDAKQLTKKVKELTYKVDKLHHSLKKRVSEFRDEL